MDFSYTGAVQTTTLAKGKYTIECWGAQGGYTGGGNGGYSVGTIELTAETTLYIYVGGQGSIGKLSAGGFNGGGASGYHASYGGSGGGASDVRIGTDSLYARVIVAGGGGGGFTSSYTGGVGGGTSGSAGKGYTTTTAGKGGTQTAGGAAGYYSTSLTGTAGTFGVGGNAATNSSSYNRATGGGGGWYGGGGTGYRNSSSYYARGSGGAGGGSGYVYTSDTAASYPDGCLLNSSYYLTDASTVDGATSITSPTGEAETGHTGDGFVRITVVATVPEAPTNIQITSLNYFDVSLSWDAIEGATKYHFGFKDGGAWFNLSNTGTVFGLTGGSTTTLQIWAENTYGEGDKAELVLQVPTAKIKQTLCDYQQISISWDASTLATNYIIYRDGTQVGTTVDTVFTDTDLLPTHSYTYEIHAVRGSYSSYSGSKVCKTDEASYAQEVVFDSVVIDPNPTTINTSLSLTVKCEDRLVIYKPEKFFSNEIYSGEV